MVMKPSPPLAGPAVDGRLILELLRTLPFDEAPALFSQWPEAFVGVLWPAALQVIAAPGAGQREPAALGVEIWALARGLPVPPHGKRLDFALREVALSQAPTLSLTALARCLVRGGGLEANLRQRRDVLDQQLAQLERLRAEQPRSVA